MCWIHSTHSCWALIVVIVGGLHTAVKVCRRPSCGALRQTAACRLVTWPDGLQVTFTSRESEPCAQHLHKYALITRNYALPLLWRRGAAWRIVRRPVSVVLYTVFCTHLPTRYTANHPRLYIHQPLTGQFITVNDLLRRFFHLYIPC